MHLLCMCFMNTRTCYTYIYIYTHTYRFLRFDSYFQFICHDKCIFKCVYAFGILMRVLFADIRTLLHLQGTIYAKYIQACVCVCVCVHLCVCARTLVCVWLTQVTCIHMYMCVYICPTIQVPCVCAHLCVPANKQYARSKQHAHTCACGCVFVCLSARIQAAYMPVCKFCVQTRLNLYT